MSARRPGPLHRVADVNRYLLWHEFQATFAYLNRNGIGFDIQQRKGCCATKSKREFGIVFYGFGRNMVIGHLIEASRDFKAFWLLSEEAHLFTVQPRPSYLAIT